MRVTRVTNIGAGRAPIRSARLKVLAGPGPEAGLEIDLPPIGVVIGANPGCDVVVADPAVSGRHCTISPAPTGFAVTDLGSKNGTFVEAKTALPEKPVLLWSKQTLRLGSLSVRFLSPPDFFDLLGSLVTRSS